MTIDMTTGFHFRPESLGLLLAWVDPEETPGFKTSFDRTFIEKILTRGVAAGARRSRSESCAGWAGLYEMTPDHHPILGPVPASKDSIWRQDSAGLESCTHRLPGKYRKGCSQSQNVMFR